jgi:NitT/TauT family transport system permease protein
MLKEIGLVVCLAFALGYGTLFWRHFAKRRTLSALAVAGARRDSHPSWQTGYLFWTSPFFLFSIFGAFSYAGIISTTWAPAPDRIILSFYRLLASGTLLSEAWASIERIAIGFASASVAGVGIGLLAGSFVAARALILPTNSFLRYIPPTAFIALLIVYFGVGETYKYAVIFFGIVFFIVQMVIDVVEDIDSKHVEMGKTCDLSDGDIFRRVIVPWSMPRVFDVLRINLSAAWTFLVAAEIIGADRGLGHLVAVSQRFLRLDDLYVGILTFGAIGLISDVVLERASRRWFGWYYISLGR